jgi:hypothetical protein
MRQCNRVKTKRRSPVRAAHEQPARPSRCRETHQSVEPLGLTAQSRPRESGLRASGRRNQIPTMQAVFHSTIVTSLRTSRSQRARIKGGLAHRATQPGARARFIADDQRPLATRRRISSELSSIAAVAGRGDVDGSVYRLKEFEPAARAFGMQLRAVNVESLEDFVGASAELDKKSGSGPRSLIFTSFSAQRTDLVALPPSAGCRRSTTKAVS